MKITVQEGDKKHEVDTHTDLGLDRDEDWMTLTPAEQDVRIYDWQHEFQEKHPAQGMRR